MASRRDRSDSSGSRRRSGSSKSGTPFSPVPNIDGVPGGTGSRRSGRSSGDSQVNEMEREFERLSTRNVPHPSLPSEVMEDDRIEINLTDPEDVMAKMEMLDLTEEETEALFEQALEVNKCLKEKLLSVEGEDALRTFSSTSSTSLPPIHNGRISFPSSRLLDHQKLYATSSQGAISQPHPRMAKGHSGKY